MTIQDLIDIARAEGRDPATMELVIGIGGCAFDIHTADEQDRFNEGWVMCAISPKDES